VLFVISAGLSMLMRKPQMMGGGGGGH